MYHLQGAQQAFIVTDSAAPFCSSYLTLFWCPQIVLKTPMPLMPFWNKSFTILQENACVFYGMKFCGARMDEVIPRAADHVGWRNPWRLWLQFWVTFYRLRHYINFYLVWFLRLLFWWKQREESRKKSESSLCCYFWYPFKNDRMDWVGSIIWTVSILLEYSSGIQEWELWLVLV